MTLRKLLALLLCLVMLLLAVGCGEAADTNDDDDDKPTKKSKTTVTTTQTGDGEVTTTTDFVTITTQRDKDTTAEPTTTTTGRPVAMLPDDQLILGDWEADVALGKVLNAAAAESGMDMFDYGDLTVTMAYHFGDDGIATMAMNVDNDATTNLTNTFMNGMDAYLQELVSAGGYDSADDLCAAMNCASIDELRDMLANSMAQMISTSLNAVTEEVEYYFTDDYLCFENADGEVETYNYTITATRLLIDYAGEIDEENASVVSTLMPLTFKKAA